VEALILIDEAIFEVEASGFDRGQGECLGRTLEVFGRPQEDPDLLELGLGRRRQQIIIEALAIPHLLQRAGESPVIIRAPDRQE
jgi:hypothetical protein